MRSPESKQRAKTNDALFTLTSNRYFDSLPVMSIDVILEANGFEGLEEGIYCGRDGQVHEQVGPNSWFNMTWHKMDVTGRYEVVAYVS